jgi:3-deoxy-7-phosphoheptulonate synthase
MTGKVVPPERVSNHGLPLLNDEELDDHDATGFVTTAPEPDTSDADDKRSKPFLIVLRGRNVGQLFSIVGDVVIGRSEDAGLRIDEPGVSRVHARVRQIDDDIFLDDMKSANGTFVNGKKIVATHHMVSGDRITIGENILKFEFQDEIEEEARRNLFSASTRNRVMVSAKRAWSTDSWEKKPAAQKVTYDNPEELAAVLTRLRRLPPLVTSWEIEELKKLIGDAQEGRRFFLQGGDCAETLDDCNSSIITNKLKILLQMSLVLISGVHLPIVRVGRFAGQYAKPRSSPTETKDGVTLPSYVGDLVNHPEFTPEARRADPQLLLECYQHASMTLNFIRSLSGGGFADLRRPEYYDLSFFDRAELPARLREEYHKMSRQIAEGLHFMKALGDGAIDELTRVQFFTSHEALSLIYEASQTREVPRAQGFYDLTTHLPWIGDRTRALGGAHVEFFRGIANPVGIKLGPSIPPDEAVQLVRALNPDNESGKIVLIVRMGASKIAAKLPPLIAAIRKADLKVLWISDPMHGNGMVTKSGIKTRNFEDILAEVESSLDIHEQSGSYFGGIHFELTGEDVTECIGGGLNEEDLDKAYLTACDPRLNYRQAVEMAFRIAKRMSSSPRSGPSTHPPPR